MKRCFLFWAMLFAISHLSGQSADEATMSATPASFQLIDPGVNELEKTRSWWEARIASSHSNSASWLGLFQHIRAEALQKEGKSFQNSTKKELSDIEKKLSELAPESYEFHLVAYLNRAFTEEGEAFLKTAIEKRPDALELLDDLAAYSIFNKDSSAPLFLAKLKGAKVYDSATMAFHRSLLDGLPTEAVIISHGNNDTYPLLIAQYVENKRRDVRIISVDHLLNQAYRERVMRLLGFPQNKDLPSNPYLCLEELIQHSSAPVFVASSFPSYWLKDKSSSLYPEGLAFRWSPEIIPSGLYDPLNFYNGFVKGTSIEPEHPIAANYLPLLISAHNVARRRSLSADAQVLRQQITDIAQNLPNQSLILQQIGE